MSIVSTAGILLQRPASVSARAFVKQFQEDWPEIPVASAREDKGNIAFEADGHTVHVMPVPGPMPWEQLEFACRWAWHWPEAEATLKPHRGHVIVGVQGPEDPVTRNLLLTYAAATAVHVYRGMAVFWKAADLVARPDEFREFAGYADAQTPPVYFWINIVPRSPDGVRIEGFVTMGMKEFGYPELQVLPNGRDQSMMSGLVADTAIYLLTHDPFVGDEQTLTVGDDRRTVRVRRVASSWDPNEASLVLDV